MCTWHLLSCALANYCLLIGQRHVVKRTRLQTTDCCEYIILNYNTCSQIHSVISFSQGVMREWDLLGCVEVGLPVHRLLIWTLKDPLKLLVCRLCHDFFTAILLQLLCQNGWSTVTATNSSVRLKQSMFPGKSNTHWPDRLPGYDLHSDNFSFQNNGIKKCTCWKTMGFRENNGFFGKTMFFFKKQCFYTTTHMIYFDYKAYQNKNYLCFT